MPQCQRCGREKLTLKKACSMCGAAAAKVKGRASHGGWPPLRTPAVDPASPSPIPDDRKPEAESVPAQVSVRIGSNAHALAPRAKGEPKATAKQLDFLRLNGVEDREFLGSLGRWQASDLVELIKGAEKKAGEKAQLGCLIIVCAIVVFIIALVRSC